MLAFNFFFLAPLYTLTLSDSRNWFALLVFVVTSIVVSELAARSAGGRARRRLLAESPPRCSSRERSDSELERISLEAAARALHAEGAAITLGAEAVPSAASP